MEIAIRNPIMNVTFPAEGRVFAIIDTGFEGFLLVPEDVFEKLSLDQLAIDERRLILADGQYTRSIGTYCEVVVPNLSVKFDGFIETIKGVEEIVIGTGLIENLKLILDYCARRIKVEACKKP
ncbi:MAG: clan AA aspartic protease [Nitrososphaeria archaeon]